jgi:carbonic anhydrase
MAYQSPIYLQTKNVINIEQHITFDGNNGGAHYNQDKKIFEIVDDIILKIKKKHYRLIEYHFHIPSEHVIQEIKYPSEIHYVFLEINKSAPFVPHDLSNSCPDVCGCQFDNIDASSNILVVGRTILDTNRHVILSTIQPKIPHHYFEYDGTLTTGDFSPVRWIVGETPVHINLDDISEVAKPVRPIQNLDGRIILFHG